MFFLYSFYAQWNIVYIAPVEILPIRDKTNHISSILNLFNVSSILRHCKWIYRKSERIERSKDVEETYGKLLRRFPTSSNNNNKSTASNPSYNCFLTTPSTNSHARVLFSSHALKENVANRSFRSEQLDRSPDLRSSERKSIYPPRSFRIRSLDRVAGPTIRTH